MKKFIQIVSLLGLLAVFPITSAFAQTGFGSQVNIPFAFNVADRAYEAGDYIVKLDRLSGGAATFSIQDTKTDDIQTVLLQVGSSFTSSEVNLVFNMVDGQRYLTRISTSDRTYALIKSKAEKEAVKAQRNVKPVDKAVISGGSNSF